MTKIQKQISAGVISVVLAIVCAIVYCLSSSTQVQTLNTIRTIEVTQNEIDYQSILNDFDNSNLVTSGSLTTFEGTKSIKLSELTGIDEVALEELEDQEEAVVKYNFSYDTQTNIVTLSAIMDNGLGVIDVDTITGVAFINDQGQIDAVMNIDGEGILLSEMQNAGMIANCGWFSNLIKKVVKVVAVVAVVAAVAVTTAAVVVATAGAAAPALVAAGVGVATSSAISTAVGVAAGGIFAATIGMSALQAGTAVAEKLSDGIEWIIDKVSGALLEIIYLGKSYAASVLTAAAVSTLSKKAYFIAVAGNDGFMYYSPIAITREYAVSIMRKNTHVSVYTYEPTNARSVAQEAGDNKSPIWERHHRSGYFDHYHLGNLTKRGEVHRVCFSHAFYGLPQFD